MAKFNLLGIALIGASLFSQTAFSSSLSDVFGKVLSTNPVLLSSQKNVDVALEKVKQERADFMPVIIATGSIRDNEQDNSTSGLQNNFTPKSLGVTLSQNLFAGGEEIYSYKSSKSLLNEAKQTHKASVQNILNDTADAYISVLTAQEVLKLQANQVELLGEQLKLTNARFSQGEVTKTDVKQAEARLAQAQAARIQAKGSFRTARTALNNLTGEIEDNLQWPKVMFDLPTEYTTDLGDIVLESHPEVLASLSTFESTKHDVKTSRASHFPKLSAVASYRDNRDTSTGDFDERSVGVELSLPLFSGGRIFSQVKESVASREQSRQDYDQVKRDIDRGLVDSIELYTTAVASLKAFRQSESAAMIAEEGVENEQLLGERTVLDLLDARQELLQARVNVTVAKGEVVTRAFTLLKALGKLDAKGASFKG